MLGRRKPAPATAPSTHDDDPNEQLAAAEQALGVLLGEIDLVRTTLSENARQRQALLDGGDDADLQKIIEIDRAAYSSNLRHEQLQRQVGGFQSAVQIAQSDCFEARWLAYRPALVEGEQRLATAIGELYDALAALHKIHMTAHKSGFASRVGEFQKVPPGALAVDVLSDFALRQFLRHHRPDEAVAA